MFNSFEYKKIILEVESLLMIIVTSGSTFNAVEHKSEKHRFKSVLRSKTASMIRKDISLRCAKKNKQGFFLELAVNPP